MKIVEYKVRPVTRYIVTRYEHEDHGDGTESCGGSECKGEFDNAEMAYQVAYALCKDEHQRHGWRIGDEHIVYPEHPDWQGGKAAKVGMAIGTVGPIGTGGTT